MWTRHTPPEPLPERKAAAAPTAPQLSGHVVTAASRDEYERARQNYNARLDFRPVEIVYCYGETDVVNAVKYGIANRRQICMRSGMHDYEGFSLNDNGLV